MADEYILRSIAIAKLTALQVTDPFATIADAKRVLADMDAADVVKVVHGKWGDNGIAGSMLVKCSVCGFDCGANSFSYCPNCGARMRQAKRGKTQRKYREILALYLYCVEVRMPDWNGCTTAGRFGFQTGETLRSTPEHTERMTDLWNRQSGARRTIRRCRCGKQRS